MPRYDFNWQTLYNLEQPIKMPKGARIDCVAHFDNSKRNKANPDYTRDVTFGSESYDEMMIRSFSSTRCAPRTNAWRQI